MGSARPCLAAFRRKGRVQTLPFSFPVHGKTVAPVTFQICLTGVFTSLCEDSAIGLATRWHGPDGMPT